MVRSNDWRHRCGDQPPQNFSLLAQAAGKPQKGPRWRVCRARCADAGPYLSSVILKRSGAAGLIGTPSGVPPGGFSWPRASAATAAGAFCWTTPRGTP